MDEATGAVTYVGADRSLGLLEAALRAAAARGQPVTGLVGFSQGAALAGLALALQERGERLQDIPALSCGVLIAGSVVRDAAYSHLYGSTHAGDTAAAAAAGASVPAPGTPALTSRGPGGPDSTSGPAAATEPGAGPGADTHQQHHPPPVANSAVGVTAASPEPLRRQQQQWPAAAGALALHPSLATSQSVTVPSPASLRCRTVHLVGSADPMRGRCEQLAGRFVEPLVLRHEQGHVMPRLAPEQREQLSSFLRIHLQPRLSASESA